VQDATRDSAADIKSCNPGTEQRTRTRGQLGTKHTGSETAAAHRAPSSAVAAVGGANGGDKTLSDLPRAEKIVRPAGASALPPSRLVLTAYASKDRRLSDSEPGIVADKATWADPHKAVRDKSSILCKNESAGNAGGAAAASHKMKIRLEGKEEKTARDGKRMRMDGKRQQENEDRA
jgi:hypothetical protein